MNVKFSIVSYLGGGVILGIGLVECVGVGVVFL